MSERTEKQLSRSERPTVTPQPTREKLFNWVEHKFTGTTEFPRYFDLRIAAKGGKEYRPETLHKQEFKANMKKPERSEMVEISNTFFSLAQDHCNEIGRVQEYVILALNHTKGSYPYGVYYLKLKPTLHISQDDGSGGTGASSPGSDEDDIRSDSSHRDRLLDHSLQHMQASDEHARFMQDGLYKSTSSVIQMLMETNRELRAENASLKALQFEWSRSMSEAADNKLDREMKAAKNKVIMDAIERGAGVLMQMVPVVMKTLESNKTGALPAAANAPITASPESIAIQQFIANLNEEQKKAVFGHIDAETQQHIPNIFSVAQVQIFDAVASLRAAPSVLSMLLPGGEHGISIEQITEIQKHVPGEMLMPLYAIIKEGQKSQGDA